MPTYEIVKGLQIFKSPIQYVRLLVTRSRKYSDFLFDAYTCNYDFSEEMQEKLRKITFDFLKKHKKHVKDGSFSTVGNTTYMSYKYEHDVIDELLYLVMKEILDIDNYVFDAAYINDGEFGKKLYPAKYVEKVGVEKACKG